MAPADFLIRSRFCLSVPPPRSIGTGFGTGSGTGLGFGDGTGLGFGDGTGLGFGDGFVTGEGLGLGVLVSFIRALKPLGIGATLALNRCDITLA